MSSIIVKQVRSIAGQHHRHRRTLVALGLRKMNASRKHKDNNCVRGMINKVRHLVSYELVND